MADHTKNRKTASSAEPFMTKLPTYILSASLFLLSACATSSTGAPPGNEYYSPETFLRKPISLAINGFNYTDVAIDSFSVDSVWGGNLLVSTPTSGGGGTTCCYALLTRSAQPISINIKWMRYAKQKQNWCHKTVFRTGPVPENPTYLNVHFMPDGDIKVEITANPGILKIELPRFSPAFRNATENTIHDQEKAICSNAQ